MNLLGEQISDSLIMTKILMTLPSSYRYFVSAWESSPSNERTLVNLTSRITIEESRNKAQDTSEAKAFAARVQISKTRGKFSKSATVVPGKCFKCHEQGHYARNCPSRKSSGLIEAENTGGSNAFNKARSNNENKARSSKSNSHSKPQGQSFISEALSTACSGNGVGAADWVLDSGASDHMRNVRGWFTTYETLKEPKAVRIGDGNYINVHGKGTINVKMFDESQWNINHLVDVLHVPEQPVLGGRSVRQGPGYGIDSIGM